MRKKRKTKISRIVRIAGLVGFAGSAALLLVMLYQSLPGNFEGHWYGYLYNGANQFRIAQVIEKDGHGNWSSRYDSFEYGIYAVPLEVVRKGRTLHLVTEEGGIIDLRLDWRGATLYGISNAQGVSSSVTLRRGMDFSAPRIGKEGKAVTAYAYQPPRELLDGWEVGDLRKEKADLGSIESGITEVLAMRDYPHLNSLVAVKGGKLVLEEYFHGYGPDDAFQVRSVTRSVFSILFGIAADQGLVTTGQRLYEFFPEYRSRPGWQAQKDGITLGMLLSMTSGFDCDDRKPPLYSCMAELWRSTNWNDLVLSGRLVHKPGEHFAYCGSCLVPLVTILDGATKMRLPDFAQSRLFGPLDIPSPRWISSANGVAEAETGLFLRPRDMAKLGALILHKGEWNRKRVVSAEWVEESTSSRVFRPGGWDFGYLWNRGRVKVRGRDIPVLFAEGRGGQYIWVVPELDLVVVTTAGNFMSDELSARPFRLFERYILNGLIGPMPTD